MQNKINNHGKAYETCLHQEVLNLIPTILLMSSLEGVTKV
jgi:hypothetical protein